MARENRSEIIQIRVTPSDRAAIERFAESKEMSVSEFGRSSMLAVMCTRGDAHALKALKMGFAAVVTDWVSSLKAAGKKAA